MSVSMFFVSPQTPEDKAFNLPVCTEDAFRRAVLPAAERAGAQYVQLFETGYELSGADAPALSKELLSVANQLEADSSEMALYALPRMKKLQTEIERIFKTHPNSVLYIG